MKITLTVGEIMEAGLWDEICELKGLNPWCINEGQLKYEEEITLNEDEVRELSQPLFSGYRYL